MTEAVRADAEAADAALMRQVQADDAEAFGVLYDRFSGRAYRVAAGIAQSRGDAEDMVQDVFVSLWRCRARYDPELGSVAGWVMATVRNRAIDVLRAQLRYDAGRDGDGQTLGERLTAADAAEQEADERDEAARLRTALAALPAAQREVIALAYFGELGAADIAGRLSLPVGTVKGRMRLGLDRLRDEGDAPNGT